MSTEKAIRRREAAALRELLEIREAPNPGRGLPSDQAQRARDETIARAQAAKAALDSARAERENCEREKRTVWERIWTSEEKAKRRRDNAPNAFEAERVQFHNEIAEAVAERNQAEHERRKAAGLAWEPVAEGGGVAVAAVFADKGLWDATWTEIRGDVLHEPSMHLRDIAHLWWALSAIEAGGGSVAIPTEPGRVPVRWPSYDIEASDGIRFRVDSLVQLERLGFLQLERGPDTVTVRYGPRTTALADSFRNLRAA